MSDHVARGVTRLAVLGSPIAHSKSPALHRAAYDLLGLDWAYDAVEVDGAGLAEFVASRDAAWRGLSLTMPLKQDVLPLLDEIDELAVLTGAANTVLFADGARLGFNTDVGGIVRALGEAGLERVRTGVLIGGGATAASALVAMAELGTTTVHLLLRRPEAAEPIAALGRRLGLVVVVSPLAELARIDDAELVVSTVPGGTDLGVAASEALMQRATAARRRVLALADDAGGAVVRRRRHGRARARDAAAPGAAAGAHLRDGRSVRGAARRGGRARRHAPIALTRLWKDRSMLRWLTAGESHGPELVAILEGLPAGIPVSLDAIRADLARRKLGYGRGARMKFEQDELAISGGVRHGESLGSPIALRIGNTEWPKWQEVMSPEPIDPATLGRGRGAPLTRPRPGHADLVGMQKYGFDEARPVLERASARETAARVALGAVARAFLAELGIRTVVAHRRDRAGARARGLAAAAARRRRPPRRRPAALLRSRDVGAHGGRGRRGPQGRRHARRRRRGARLRRAARASARTSTGTAASTRSSPPR